MMNRSRKASLAALGVAAGAATVIGLSRVPKPVSVAPASVAGVSYPVGVLPRMDLTPGDTLPGATIDTVTAKAYAQEERSVPQAEKDAVLREYGYDPKHHVDGEVDHFLSLTVSGSNNIRNLWFEPENVPYGVYQLGYHTKDLLENRLHVLLMRRQITLVDAVDALRTDWPASYRKYVGEWPKVKP